MRNIKSLLLLPLLLSGCEWVGNTADSIGNHLPVIGERCEHWQCMTESGRTQSDLNRARRERETQQDAAAPAEGQP